MPKTIAQLEIETTNSLTSHAERLSSLQALVEVLQSQREKLLESTNQVRADCDLMKHRLDEQQKQLDKWDSRVWGLVIVLIGAILSLASGLIVALSRKSS